MPEPGTQQEKNAAVEKRPFLSVVCPIFNEEEGTPALMDLFREVLSGLDQTYELIIVDDGSSDQTLAKAKASLTKIPNLRVVELYRNYGQIAAIGAGMSVARGEWIVMLDGDLQHDPNDITRLLKEIANGHDLVATYREKREETRLRLFITWCMNRVNRYATGVKIRDFGSGYRLFNANLLDMITDQNGYVYYNTPALYIYARSVVEVPITQSRRAHGSSKWTIDAFILFNLDFFLHSKKATQILFTAGIFGIFSGVFLYTVSLLGITEARSISAPITIAFTSFLVILLGIVWREVLRTQRFALGLPPFIIRSIWCAGEDSNPTTELEPKLRTGRAIPEAHLKRQVTTSSF